jgi:chemotaxis protein MotB
MGDLDFFDAAITLMKLPAAIPYFARVPRRVLSPDQRHEFSEGINVDNGWLVTLSDLTLLLLCFLVVWYVKNQVQKSSPETANSVTPSMQSSHPPQDAMPNGAHDADWQALQEEIKKFIVGAGMSRDVAFAAVPNEILISFKDTVPFASGKADLKPRALPVLEKVAAVAVSRPQLQVWISGHTDDRPISTAEFPSNWELSSARASRVARYLIEKGVHPARIAVNGFAYHRPRVGNDNRANRGANRRVELRLVRGSELVTTQNPTAPSR